jgi:hypothetical protein
MLKGYLSRLPLTDRITFSRELWSGTFYGILTGIALPLVTIMARKIGVSTRAITAMVTMQFLGTSSSTNTLLPSRRKLLNSGSPLPR